MFLGLFQDSPIFLKVHRVFCHSMRSFLADILQFVVLTFNEMGRACGAYGGGKRCAQGVGGEAWGKEAIGETKT